METKNLYTINSTRNSLWSSQNKKRFL